MRNHESVCCRSTAVVHGRMTMGLTVIEVLFAMVIILVGLVGVAAMIPFAIRQAEDSYRITHGLAAGENALGILKSQSVVQPRIDAPWQMVNDEWVGGDSMVTMGNKNVPWAVTSWNDFYQGVEYKKRVTTLGLTTGANGSFDTISNKHAIALLQNQIIGTTFCIDPLFWGYQERGVKIALGDRGNYRRSRFPFYKEGTPNSLNPFDATVTFETPRMRRISIADPMGPDGNGNAGWLRLPASLQLSAVSGGDISPAKPDEDKSAAPLRGEYVDGAGALMQSPTNAASVSWMATLTPSDSTPIIRFASLDLSNFTNLASPPPIELFPESYDLAVVVFGKRDVREQLDPTTQIVPESERLGLMLGVPNDLEYLTSGTFDIMIDSGPNVDSKIKVGDWLMLSRYIYLTYPDPPIKQLPFQPVSSPCSHTDAKTYATRERHKWYRVLSVDPDEPFPKSVRVSGQPWDYTEQELADARVIDPSLASLKMPQTTVTLLKNVLQVFQRTVYLQSY